MSSILDKLIALNSEEGRGAAAREWKEQGGRVIGYFCSYMPEEIVHAAGLLPYRVMGSWREDFFWPKPICLSTPVATVAVLSMACSRKIITS